MITTNREIVTFAITNPTINRLFILLVLFNIIDVITTSQLIAMYSIEVEINPFMRSIIENFGNAGMIAFKALVIGFLWVLYVLTGHTRITHGLILVVVAYGVLAIHNMVLCTYIVWML